MKTQAELILIYKDLIDHFGGIIRFSGIFDISTSTVYTWLRGRTMMSHCLAMIVAAKSNEAFCYEDLVLEPLPCKKIYQQVLVFFGSQTKVAQALKISQSAVHAWLYGYSDISEEKAVLLESISAGEFSYSDFFSQKQREAA